MTFDEWFAKEYHEQVAVEGEDGLRDLLREAWDAARSSCIEECRAACLSVGSDAHEAAQAKDATDYIAGYQDASVDCDEALRDLSSCEQE
jgi:dGTP triphosphohydrolase